MPGYHAFESQKGMPPSIATTFQSLPSESSDDWVTAKVIDSKRARRFINRLDVLGYDYKVVPQNHDLRILVRRQTLEEVLGWIKELSYRPQMRHSSRALNHSGIYLLIAIPIGILAGSVGARLLGIQSPASYAIAGYAGLAASGLAFLASSRLSKQR